MADPRHQEATGRGIVVLSGPLDPYLHEAVSPARATVPVPVPWRLVTALSAPHAQPRLDCRPLVSGGCRGTPSTSSASSASIPSSPPPLALLCAQACLSLWRAATAALRSSATRHDGGRCVPWDTRRERAWAPTFPALCLCDGTESPPGHGPAMPAKRAASICVDARATWGAPGTGTVRRRSVRRVPAARDSSGSACSCGGYYRRVNIVSRHDSMHLQLCTWSYRYPALGRRNTHLAGRALAALPAPPAATIMVPHAVLWQRCKPVISCLRLLHKQ